MSKTQGPFETVLTALRKHLTPPTWTESTGIMHASFTVKGWGHRGDHDNGVRLYFYRGIGSIVHVLYVQVSRYGLITGQTLPERSYSVGNERSLRNDWQKELAKALKCAQTRVKQIIEDVTKRKEEQEKEKDADCYKPHPWKSGELLLRTVEPKLTIDGALTLRIDERVTVDAEQAARLFAVLGGKLQVQVSGDLTPEQWLTIRDIFQ